MLILGDISDNTWSVVEEDESSFSATISIGFRDSGNLPVTFSGLSFGYSIEDSGVAVAEETYPLGDLVYVSTDQGHITSSRVDGLIPEKEYTVSFWAENDGQSFQGSTAITLPRPTQPYPSWIYNTDTYSWESPTPYPEDGERYIWDEDTQSWVLADV